MEEEYETIFVKKGMAEKWVNIVNSVDIDEIMVIKKEEYSDLKMCQKNYELAKENIDRLQKIIDNLNRQKLILAKAYTDAKTLR